jgi:DNA-binding GntR family transcriptional regulator
MRAETKKRNGDHAPGKQERCYAVIRQRILDGIYPPGYRLIQGDLARELSVSMVPVREAVRRLEAEGLIAYRRNIGATVASVDLTYLCDLMQAQAVLESSATALSAPAVREKSLIQLKRLNDQMQSELKKFDFNGYMDLNRKFHELVVDHCPNHYLAKLWRSTTERIQPLRGLFFRQFPERARDAIQEHRKLIRLIEDKAPAAVIERYACFHVSKSVDWFLKHHPKV